MFKTLRPALALAAFALTASAPAFANPIVAGFDGNTLAANDDGYTGLQSLGFSANFFGVTYSGAYVNNNGNLTFSAAQSAYSPYGLGSSYQSIIAPFFADVDTRGAGSGLVTYGTGTYDGHNAFAATYPNVGYYSFGTDKLDNFQVLLVDRSDVAAGDFDIYFNYGSMQWETGGASGGSDGLGGDCAVAGYSNGEIAGMNETTTELAGSGTCGALIDGGVDALSTHTNDGVTGQYLFEARDGQVVTPPMSATPEPSSLVLLGTGILSVAGAARRKFRKA